MKVVVRVRNWLKNSTIGKKLMLFNLLVVLLPTAIVLFMFYDQFYSIIQGSVLDSQSVTSLQAAKNIDSTVSKLLSVTGTISGDENLPALLAALKTPQYDVSQREALQARFATFSAVVHSHIDKASISAIRIYTDMENHPFAQAGGVLFEDIDTVRNTYWHGIFLSVRPHTLFAPEYYLGKNERDQLGSLAAIQQISYESDGGTHTAYIAVYSQSDLLAEPISDIETESVEGVISYIINARDTVVAQTDETAYGTYAMSYDEIAENISGEGLFVQKDVAGVQVFITYREIRSTDWRMAWIVPYDSILSQSKNIISKFVLIYLMIVLFVFVIGLLLARTIADRINSLRDQMQKIKTERPQPLSLEPGKDEVGDLIGTYHYMVERINALLDDTMQKAEELNNVKITALRAQIDPHFLYNTLDMINWLTKNGKSERASEAIVALSRFYRLTLNRGNLTATVAAELEHVSLYVKLMNMRFDNTIDYLVDVPEEMMDYEIPLIIFQPIVENAIQHGIFEKRSHNGTIIITGWIDDDTLCFLISDDGIGMTAEQIAALQLTEGQGNNPGGIGVYNTHRRLQLIYRSTDCGLFYSSEYGKGTDVIFRIPITTVQEGPQDEAE